MGCLDNTKGGEMGSLIPSGGDMNVISKLDTLFSEHT